MSADVPTSASLAPFAFRLAAAAGQLYLDHALGHNVVDLELGMDRVAVPDLRHCQAQQRSCRVHKPAVTKAPGEEEVLYVPAAGCELLPHLGVEVVVASVDVVVDKLSGSPTTGNRMSFSSFRIFWKRVGIGLITEDNQGFEPLTS